MPTKQGHCGPAKTTGQAGQGVQGWDVESCTHRGRGGPKGDGLLGSAFHNNLQALQESFSFIHKMSQTMTAYYWQKNRERCGCGNRGSTLAMGPARRALRTPRRQQSTLTSETTGEHEVADNPHPEQCPHVRTPSIGCHTTVSARPPPLRYVESSRLNHSSFWEMMQVHRTAYKCLDSCL